MIPYQAFLIRLEETRLRIRAACERAGRPFQEVQLLPVTKTHPAAAAEFVAQAGLPVVGENRVQEAADKRDQAQAPALRWDLIGHLQSNKARLAARTFDRIQSVDREKLVGALDQAAGELGKTLEVFLQINAGYDPAKFGADPADAPRLLEAVLGAKNLRVTGLMTIAPLSDDPAVAERTFAHLRTIRDDLVTRFQTSLPELSMGMSGDLEAAVAAGSTIVRVGTALFGSRE